MIRSAAAIALAIGAFGLTPGSASATFHLMKIREVATNPAGPDSSYVELQMYAFGQNFVGGHKITAYTSTGTLLGTSTFPPSPGGDVANGDNQRTVLVGDTATPGSPDYVDSVLADFLSTASAGGAVCWENIDCVSWGAFTGAASLPSPPGTPAAAIPDGSALVRSIAPNCPTLLENADDTNNSIADFSIAPPAPRNNSVTPTENACTGGNGPDTSITKGPKKKTKKKKAKFEFSSTTPGATFECSVDGKPFEACSSPFKVKVKKGKHTFEVRAVLGGVSDPSPAKQNWKVKKPK
jgi:hypothetical protein